MNILNKINFPKDLKSLKNEDLLFLVEDIRMFLIDKVSKTGGHLGANLGVIELTIALHYVFDFGYKDDIIFDVGHQAYIHKILTGRKDLFGSLRQFNGLSGYTNFNESKYDKYMFGHAGTALSVASGIASVKSLEKKFFSKTVVFVGDASIVAGISFEAMNYLGEKQKDLIIVLNDNSMSISKTVGQLAHYFTKLRGSKTFLYIKSSIKYFLDKLPYLLRSFFTRILLQFRKLTKKTIYQNNLFQIFNFDYYGPIDGHDLFYMINLFKHIKEKKGPILLHIITDKGKGLDCTKSNEKFHAIKPESGNKENKSNKKK